MNIEDPERSDMTDFIARFEQQLIAAKRPRTWRLRRPVVLAVLGVTLATGTAVAAMTPWLPNLGSEHPREFQIAGSPVAPEQRAQLAVLRREQTAIDRGAVTQNALRYFSTNTGGVRTDSIRALGAGRPDAVLVPVTTYSKLVAPGATPSTGRDGLCLFVADAGDGGFQRCFGTDDLLEGTIYGALAGRDSIRYFGIAPDSVVRVRAIRARLEPIDVPLTENYYAYTQAKDAADDAVRSFELLDGDGEIVRSLPGLTLSKTSAAPNLHSCGNGRVVPYPKGTVPDPAKLCR